MPFRGEENKCIVSQFRKLKQTRKLRSSTDAHSEHEILFREGSAKLERAIHRYLLSDLDIIIRIFVHSVLRSCYSTSHSLIAVTEILDSAPTGLSHDFRLFPTDVDSVKDQSSTGMLVSVLTDTGFRSFPFKAWRSQNIIFPEIFHL